jgi:hypothetical protein
LEAAAVRPGAERFFVFTVKIASHLQTKPMRRPCLFLAIAFAAFTLPAAETPDFTLHEWGTFTSVSGSDGVLLPGLEREEEPLPGFVFQHDGMPPKPKGYARPLHNVTVKMETPVIYFYANQPFAAHVRVGFNGGSISQWFPARSGGETPPSVPRPNLFGSGGGDIDFAKKYQGGIEWNVQVQPPSADDNAAVFKPGETPTWIYPRQTDASLVRTADGAAEKFLFYRGVGNFPLPVKFTLPEDGTLHMENVSKETIPSVFIFNRPGYDDKAAFVLLDPLGAGEERAVKLAEPKSSPNWKHEVYAAMRGALVQAGLFPKEADAMLQTWWRSYFERPGLRVFWIAPEKITGEILPLTVEPSPRNQVRVLVGRSELLTPSFEQELVKQFAPTNQNLNAWAGDRYFGAFEARVNVLKAAR